MCVFKWHAVLIDSLKISIGNRDELLQLLVDTSSKKYKKIDEEEQLG